MASTVEFRVKDSHHTVLLLIVFLRFFVTPFIFTVLQPETFGNECSETLLILGN